MYQISTDLPKFCRKYYIKNRGGPIIFPDKLYTGYFRYYWYF